MMGGGKDDTEALFKEMDGPFLIGLGNWLARSLDMSELSNEEILLLEMVLGRCQEALWREFPEIFGTILTRRLGLWLSGADDTDSDDSDDSNDSDDDSDDDT